MPTRATIIGCGAVVRDSYVRTLPQPGRVRVVTVFDRNPDAASQVARLLGARVAGSIEEALADVEFAFIATPPASHAELVGAALAAGRDVFCEKPFVATHREALDLVRRADAVGRKLYVGHFRRTFPALRAARELIASGVLGEVLSIDVREGGRFAWPASSDYFLTDALGGALLDTGSHTMDMALYATHLDHRDLSVSVEHVLQDARQPDHETTASGTLGLPGREVGFTLGVSRRVALSNRLRITCREGTVDCPVSMLPRLRITGPSGSTVVTTAGIETYDEAFAQQWDWVFGAGGQDLEANRFVNLARVLEAIGTAGSVVAR